MGEKRVYYLGLKDGFLSPGVGNGEISDPVRLAATAFLAGADEIMVGDLSSKPDPDGKIQDGAKEKNLAVIREICDAVDLPVTVEAYINRFEDAKKYFYAGCAKVFNLNTGEAAAPAMSEARERFGEERISFAPETREAFASLDTLKEASGREPRPRFTGQIAWSALKKNADGLLPVVVQDDATERVLMVAYMNEEAFDETLRSGRMTYYSRSRETLWIKGEESGHYQYLRKLSADCDLDTLLARIKQVGAACHTGEVSCFFNDVTKGEATSGTNVAVLRQIYDTIADRKNHPREGSYTNYLFDKGIDKILKKVGEESTEIVIAAKNPDENEIIYEISDYLYHLMVLMAEKNVTWDDIFTELNKRHT